LRSTLDREVYALDRGVYALDRGVYALERGVVWLRIILLHWFSRINLNPRLEIVGLFKDQLL